MWSSRCIRWHGVVRHSFSHSQHQWKLVHCRLSSNAAKSSRVPDDGLELKDFVRNSQAAASCNDSVPSAAAGESGSEPVYAFHASRSTEPDERQRSFYLETYGCQMNVSDSEIVHSILEKSGIHKTERIDDADIILVNTCSIREKAEERVWNRLYEFRALQRKEKRSRPRIVGVLGCMAERLKEKLLEKDKLVDVVVGPDAYRDLPRLLARAEDGDTAINTLLSLDETYADVAPVRTADNRVSAYVSIMRGCNNMCSYCIVPWTRGRERSRHIKSILDEVKALSDAGFKEVTLLGQNVNSYNDVTSAEKRSYSLPEHNLSNEGFTQKSKLSQIGIRFPELLKRVSEVDPEMRIRFTSPHPKDFPMDLLKLISERANLCKQLHIPAQSGSSRVLELMRRDYSRETYIELIDNVRKVLPNVSLSSDFISGFCGERDEDHAQTLDLMRHVKYDAAFMFAFSQRERTHAHRKLVDDVPERVKLQRLEEVRDTFIDIAKRESQRMVDTIQLALVEGRSKRSADHLSGRIDSNKKVVFPKREVPASLGESDPVTIVPGDYVVVRIVSATQASLTGEPLARTTLTEYHWLMTNCLFFNGDIFKPSPATETSYQTPTETPTESPTETSSTAK